VISDIEGNPKVALGFSSEAGIFSDGIYIAVEGEADLVRDNAGFQRHWNPDLDKWFEKGIETPGLVLIRVKAKRLTCWKGREEFDVKL
jgi:general stress protein 26